jgi:hypothetical protein
MRIAMTLAAAAVLLATAGSARSADTGMCETYTNNAIARAEQWRDLGCGTNDEPKWSLDRAVHFGWCLESEEESVQYQDENRRLELENCICRHYADSAIEQNARSIQNGCGFTGPRWDGDVDNHFRWCFNEGNGTPDFQAETAERERQLAICTGG